MALSSDHHEDSEIRFTVMDTRRLSGLSMHQWREILRAKEVIAIIKQDAER